MGKNLRLVIISGPSGSGKTTICNLLKKNPRIKQSVSYTTRLPREDEKDGVDYNFVDRSEFERLINEEKFIEYAEYCGNLYGTPFDPINETPDNDTIYILAIDVKGALQVMKKVPEAVSVFVTAPDFETLKSRLKNRLTDGEDIIDKRIEIAKKEMEYAEHYDYCVVNNSVEVAVKEIESILKV